MKVSCEKKNSSGFKQKELVKKKSHRLPQHKHLLHGERVLRFLMYCNCNLGIRIEISHCEMAKGNETQKWPKE